MQLFKNKIKNLQIQTILLSFVIGITVLMMLHDYLASVLFNQSYYLSESLLFKINILLLIIPIVVFGYFNDFRFSKEINVTQIMIYLIPIVITHIVMASWLIAFVSHNLMESPFTFNFLIKNKFNQDFVFLITIYGLLFLIARYHSLNVQPKKIKPIETLSIKQGSTTEIIAVEDINWINAETPYVGIWIENKKYLYPSSLSSILTKLDNDNFIRIHKSTIVNKSKILSIHSRSNGDYDIKLNDNTLLRLSRNYRSKFKTQLK
jgi:hypothetical protein